MRFFNRYVWMGLLFIVLAVGLVLSAPKLIANYLEGPLAELQAMGVEVRLQEVSWNRVVVSMRSERFGIQSEREEFKLRYHWRPLGVDVVWFGDLAGGYQLKVLLGVRRVGADAEVWVTHSGIPLKAHAKGNLELSTMNGVVVLMPDFESPWVRLLEPMTLQLSQSEMGYDFMIAPSRLRPEWKKSEFQDLIEREWKLGIKGDYDTKKSELSFVATGDEPSELIRIEAKGRVDTESLATSVKSVVSVNLTDALEFKNLFPAYEKEVQFEDLAIKAKVDLSSKGTQINRMRASFSLKAGGGVAWEIPFQGLSVAGDLELLPRLKTMKPLLATVGRVGGDMAVEGIRIPFAIASSQKLWVHGIQGRLMGGELMAPRFDVSLPKGDFKVAMTLQHLSLAKLLKSIDANGLKGSGLLEGRLPMAYHDSEFVLSEGYLRNEGAGLIQYQDSMGEPTLGKIEYLDQFEGLLAKGQQALVMKALDNFRYTDLKLKASRSAKVMSVLIHLKGSNPDLVKGQVFELNLPIEGSVESLIRDSFRKSFALE